MAQYATASLKALSMANAEREFGETNQLEFPRVSRSTFSRRRTPTRPMATRPSTGRSLGRRGDLFAYTSDSRFPWAVEYADPRLRGWVRRSIPVRSIYILSSSASCVRRKNQAVLQMAKVNSITIGFELRDSGYTFQRPVTVEAGRNGVLTSPNHSAGPWIWV
jgi:hypothetical protein